MHQGFRGQAMVALVLVEEEAECIRLSHSELGGTELAQGSNGRVWGHSQGLGGATCVGVLVGYTEEVLCRKQGQVFSSTESPPPQQKGQAEAVQG